jgi:hypothetical protein
MKAIGYQKLIELYGLSVREPARFSWVRLKGSERTSKLEDGREVEIYPPRYDPGEEWQAHLGFALKHEGINLEILAAVLAKAPVRELTAWVKGAPTSRYCRIAWFLYEWICGKTLSIADLKQGNYLSVLDENAYY